MANEQIKKANNGTYHFRVNLGHDSNGKKIQNTDHEIENEEPVNEMVFEEFTNEIFLQWYKSQVKERTYINRKYVIKDQFSYFYKYKVSQITIFHIQKWQIELINKYKPLYAREIFRQFSTVLNRAVIQWKEKQASVIDTELVASYTGTPFTKSTLGNCND